METLRTLFLALVVSTFIVLCIVLNLVQRKDAHDSIGNIQEYLIPESICAYRCEESVQLAILKEKTKNSTEYSQYIVPYNKQTMCQAYPDTKDWSFQCSVRCKELKLADIPSTDVNVIKSCAMQEGVSWSIIANRTFFHVSYKSKCLENLIREHCQTSNAVPNIVHYVWFSKREMNFFHFLSFLSALKHIKPCLLLVHGDVPYGLYWEYIVLIANNIINVKMVAPTKIFEKQIGCVEHQADVARLLVLREYGGIYLDTDEIILKPLEDLRNHNFTLGHEIDNNLSNAVILSSPNATFISHWLDGYKTYNRTQWAVHSTFLPYQLSLKYPHLLHVENKTFVWPNFNQFPLLYEKNFNWSHNYAIHLYLRFYKRLHTFIDIRRLNTTIGSVARSILYDTRELCFDV